MTLDRYRSNPFGISFPLDRRPAGIDRVIGEQVRVRRESSGLSLTDLAAKLGVSAQDLGELEEGSRRFSPSTLIAAGRILGFQPSDLFQNVERAFSLHGLPAPANANGKSDYSALRERVETLIAHCSDLLHVLDVIQEENEA